MESTAVNTKRGYVECEIASTQAGIEDKGICASGNASEWRGKSDDRDARAAPIECAHFQVRARNRIQ